MNDRLSAFCAGMGFAGFALVIQRILEPRLPLGEMLLLIFFIVMIGVGLLDFILDHWGRADRRPPDSPPDPGRTLKGA